MFSEKIGSENFFFLEPKFRPDEHHLSSGSRSNESSRRNLAERPAYFAGCRLLSTTLCTYTEYQDWR